MMNRNWFLIILCNSIFLFHSSKWQTPQYHQPDPSREGYQYEHEKEKSKYGFSKTLSEKYDWLSKGSIVEYFSVPNRTSSFSPYFSGNATDANNPSLDNNDSGVWQSALIAHINHNRGTFDIIVKLGGEGRVVHNLTVQDENVVWRLPLCQKGSRGIVRFRRKNGPKVEPRPRLNEDFIKRFIIVPEYKLMFCYIEKVGGTMFNTLFNMLRLMHPNMTKEEATYLSSSIFSRNVFRHFSLDLQDLEDILINPNWTKAVFYRNPVDRFLSAFRSKCEHRDQDGSNHCQQSFGDGSASFANVLYDITQKGHHESYVNPHFAEMVEFCGGLGSTLDFYDIVQPMGGPGSDEAIATMLEQVGVGTESVDLLIKHVVQTRGRVSEDIADAKRRFGLEISYETEEDHDSAASYHLDEYFPTNTEVFLVEDYYSNDYHLFKIPRQGQDCIVER